MDYIYVRTTRIEHVTPEWADGRSHIVQHVSWIAYPADSKPAQDWLMWVESLPSKLQAAYVQDLERWQEMQQFGISERLERV